MLGLVHGHFLGDERETAVVAVQWRLKEGLSPETFLFSRDPNGWRLELRDTSETIAYCRVIPANANKDLLLCQSEIIGPTGRYGRGRVDTNLFTVDFTQSEPVSYFLHLEDTVAAGSTCLSWASVKSLEFSREMVRVGVDYGRKQLPLDEGARIEFKKRAMQAQGSPRGFPFRLFTLEFKIGEAGLSLADTSTADYNYVTANWTKDASPPCSAVNER